MQAIGNVNSFASTSSIIAPKKTPETPMDRYKKQIENKREIEYQKAKAKPIEELTDREKLIILFHTINNLLSSTSVVYNANSSQALNYNA